MKNKKNEYCEPVEITQECNGFIVYVGSSCSPSPRDQYVFQTFNELVKFLGENFTHREKNIITD